MWFKNIQLFELVSSFDLTATELAAKLEKLAFSPCPATLPSTAGWNAPTEDEQAPLVYALNGYMMICLQTEEKILPATVVRQELKEQIKKLETTRQAKIAAKEKYSIKDSIYNSLLPKAFSKKAKIYAYFDTKNNWLIIDTVSPNKTKLFLDMLKKTVPNMTPKAPDLKKLPTVMTHWLLNNSYPSSFGIEKSCVLQDPQQQGRTIRCQQQDLSARTVQAVLKDGYEVHQLALSWQDEVLLTLVDDFSFKSLKYQDAVLELAQEDRSESPEDRFSADFAIMADVLTKILLELVETLKK